MRLLIHSHGVPLSADQSAEIERRFLFALSRFSPRIDRAVLRIHDVNGPRGGVDKQLHVRITLRGARAVQVLEHCADLASGVSQAAERIGRTVARTLERARSFARR